MSLNPQAIYEQKTQIPVAVASVVYGAYLLTAEPSAIGVLISTFLLSFGGVILVYAFLEVKQYDEDYNDELRIRLEERIDFYETIHKKNQEKIEDAETAEEQGYIGGASHAYMDVANDLQFMLDDHQRKLNRKDGDD